jgi:Ca2+-binding EF-hand superfamily protein
MRRQFSSTILQYSVRLLACCILANGITLRAQNTGQPITIRAQGNGQIVSMRAPNGAAPGGEPVFTTGTGFGLAINGSDIGTILLKTCDLDQDGKVTLAEFKTVTAASLKVWDANGDGSLNTDELSAGLEKLFPAPPPGAQAMAGVNVNGVPVQVPPDQLPTPDKQFVKHIIPLTDTNKDGLISLQELNDFLDKSFSQWDQNGNGSLDTHELANAFGQLAMPDPPR